MDVGTMRRYVRDHLEVDDEELPDTVLNEYLEDAFERTLAADNRWPRAEEIWTITKLEGSDSVELPADCLLPSIMSVVDVNRGIRLVQLNHENAEDSFLSPDNIAIGVPLYYSIWKRTMYLWPRVETQSELQLSMRGYRRPTWSNVASAIPDIDSTLHHALCYFAMSLAYAAQEDEILEGVALSRWDRDVRQQVKMLTQPAMHRPLVMHGGAPSGGVPPFVIVPPNGSP